MLKILAGEYRSRILATPRDDAISRPYTSRVKESIFNLLRGWCEGATVIDLFAGVGTVGLETASRGAARVFMVERDPKVFALLQQNVESLACADRVTAVCGDALTQTTLDRAPRRADLIFIDPPYEMMENDIARERVLKHIARCRELMADRGFVILRSPTSAGEWTIPGFEGPEIHKYGAEMHVMLYAPTGGFIGSPGTG